LTPFNFEDILGCDRFGGGGKGEMEPKRQRDAKMALAQNKISQFFHTKQKDIRAMNLM